MRKLVLFCSLLVFVSSSLKSRAQQYVGGLQFEVKPDFRFQGGWTLHSKFTSRTLFVTGGYGAGFQGDARYERSEIELIASKKVGNGQAAGFGYLLRNQEGNIRQRLIQQYSFSRKPAGFLSMGHRFRLDETFQKSKEVLYRVRYRFSFKKPLENSGGKRYWFLNNEYFGNLQGGEPSMELRAFPGLGFQLHPRHALEVGLDYRFENLFSPPTKQIFLLGIAWVPSFN